MGNQNILAKTLKQYFEEVQVDSSKRITQPLLIKVFQSITMLMSIIFVVFKSDGPPVNQLLEIPSYKYFVNGLNDYYDKKGIRQILLVSPTPDQTSLKTGNIKFRTEQQLKKQTIAGNAKIQWLQYEDPRLLFDFNGKIVFSQLKKISELASQGVTIIWSTRQKFIQHWNHQKSNPQIQLFQKAGLFYDEMPSLNLRSLQQKIILIFSKIQPKTKVGASYPGKPTKNFMSIQVVFRMEENIEYLREWIGYHINLGVDKFFLYDNIGTSGKQSRYLGNKTKYGVSLECFGKDMEKKKQKFNQIWEDFRNHIVYVPWQPRRSTGEVFYGQIQAVNHYEYFYQDTSLFCAFIDIDEFLFSPRNHNLETFLTKKHQEGCTVLRLMQTKFSNRFCNPRKRVIDIYAYFPAHTSQWATKTIVLVKALEGGQRSIHEIQHKFGREQTIEMMDLRFNHYNMLKGMIGFARHHGFSNATKMEVDNSMSRYDQAMNEICENDKCTQNFQLQCDQDQIRCLKLGQQYS